MTLSVTSQESGEEVRRVARNLKPVNVDYLKEVVKISGKSVEAFCNAIGRTSSAYYNILSRGVCQDVILRAIANVHKCDYNKLVLPDPERVQPETVETPKASEQTGSLEKDIEYIKQMLYCIMESNDRIAKLTEELKSVIADFLTN